MLLRLLNLTYNTVHNNFEHGSMSKNPFQSHSRPTEVDAVFLCGDRYLKYVVGLFVVRFPFGRIDELVNADEMQMSIVASNS